MTVATSVIRPLFSTPYITVDEYRQAPTGINVDQLVPRDPAASRAELANVIARASSLADGYCGQILAATVDTDVARIRVDRDGAVHVHPRQTPIIQVNAFAFGTAPNTLTQVTDLSGVWIEAAEFHVPLTSGSVSWQGALQFSAAQSGGWAYCRWTTVSGWPNTTLAATAAAASTSLKVGDATGIVAGITQLAVYDGAQAENVQVAASWTGGTTLPLTAPLLYTHDQTGVAVSALPPDVRQAAILLTTAMIKTRGAAAVVAQSVSQLKAHVAKSGDKSAMDDLELAFLLLAPYRRVR